MLPLAVQAEALVLVQGYLGDGWRDSGIIPALEAAGWEDGGRLSAGPHGVRGALRQGGRRYYTLVLPTEAPMGHQLGYMERYLAFLRARHEHETLILAGHSAGGVLARLYMVRHPEMGIDALITIASPHLGTGSAEVGAMAGQSPLGWVAPFFGGSTLNRSQALYGELVRERPGSLLFWLNRQAHPPATYVSIVRQDDSLFGLGGDLVVAARSQDMNQVYALRGRAWAIRTAGGHGLQASDGQLLLRILRQLQGA